VEVGDAVASDQVLPNARVNFEGELTNSADSIMFAQRLSDDARFGTSMPQWISGNAFDENRLRLQRQTDIFREARDRLYLIVPRGWNSYVVTTEGRD